MINLDYFMAGVATAAVIIQILVIGYDKRK